MALPSASLSGDGADNGGHVELQYDPAQGICEVREWSIDYSREQLDVTTLPCTVGASAGAAKWAATKKFQGGYAEITGTMTLYITDNESSLATRLMESVHLNIQDGARSSSTWMQCLMVTPLIRSLMTQPRR